MAVVSDVVFDVGRVLIDFSYDRFAAKLRQQGAVCEGPEGFLAHVDLICYEHGEISSDEFLLQINALLKQPLPLAELAAAWNNLFTPIQEMLDVAGRLKQHCGVYLLSNTSELHWRYLQEAFGLDNICHGLLASYEVGVMKPAPEIFAAACSRFDLRPETSVFIDDLEANVKGAIACGWHGIWHRTITSSKAELQRLTGVKL
ncbi:HAD family hydrolase [Malonomonas rubra]|uniref:HAD family hydrolase n=1 Tax=Malonomonas rubra TaxID=57040 RepID=UPI0026EC5154|nr:HAD family phosphatase [Malonomonas rubra]